METTHIIETERYSIHSTMDEPLVVDADSRERALYMGLQLLERETRIEHLSFQYTEDGTLFATDADHNEHFAVRAQNTVTQARAA